MNGPGRIRGFRAAAGDRGDAMIQIVVALPFLLVGLSALIEAGRHHNATREAGVVAAAAARAGAQPDLETLRAGGPPSRAARFRMAEAARDMADRNLAGRPGVTVAVAVESSGRVLVTVTMPMDHRLPAPGLPGVATATAAASPVEAIDR